MLAHHQHQRGSHWSPSAFHISTSSTGQTPRSHLNLTTSLSKSSTFSDISSSGRSSLRSPSPAASARSTGSSRTHAFFSSPFSSLPPSPPSVKQKLAPLPNETTPSGNRSLTADFFASPTSSAGPTPPPSLYTHSRDPSPLSGHSHSGHGHSHGHSRGVSEGQGLLSAPPVKEATRARPPPLARFFPSRYNSDPGLSRLSTASPSFNNIEDADPLYVPHDSHYHQRQFFELDSVTRTSPTFDESILPDPDATPYLHHLQQPNYFETERPYPAFVYVDELEHGHDHDYSELDSMSTSPSSWGGLHGHDTDIISSEPEQVLEPGVLLPGSPAFQLVRALGRGAFSTVWLARPHNELAGGDGKLVAVKIAPRDDEITARTFEREAEILKHISHPNIVPVLSSTSIPRSLSGHRRIPRKTLVLPYIPSGDLLDLVNSDSRHALLSEGGLKRIVGELVRVVGWLHRGFTLGGENGQGDLAIVHRDVKLENILLTSANLTTAATSSNPYEPLIKLTDFGLSRMIDTASPLLSTRCGSEAYAAPELVVGGHRHNDNDNVDDYEPISSRSFQVISRKDVQGTIKKPIKTHSRVSSIDKDKYGWYDGRQTDAWAVGVLIYALVHRALPFGEGVDNGSVGPGAGAAGKLTGVAARFGSGFDRRGREREREKARRSWLTKIAKGEYEWPCLSSTLSSMSMNPGSKGELCGPNLCQSAGIKRVVEKLLVRDAKKRATLHEVWEDPWFDDVRESIDSLESGNQGQWKVDDGGIRQVAWREIE